MALLDELASDVQSERASAVTEYRQLLDRADDPKPGDVARMRTLLAALDLTPDNTRAHLRALAEAARLKKQFLAPAEKERLQQKLSELKKEMADWYRRKIASYIERYDTDLLHHLFDMVAGVSQIPAEEWGKTMAERQQKSSAANGAYLDLHNAERQSEQAVQALAKLKSDNPLVFGS